MTARAWTRRPAFHRGQAGVMDKDAADRLTDTECYNLIFAPGFSTKTEISDVSGRGVGMDVVKTKISQLNGSINIYSAKGQGSKIVIKVPLTLAIMPTLMVMLGNQAFAFPLVNVNESSTSTCRAPTWWTARKW
jgi:two-component system chemotaxis sensor kinase CheA